MTHWLDSLSAADREETLLIMRAARAASDQYLQTGRDLSPRGMEVAVGGEHFSAFIKGEAIATVLREIAKGYTPAYAAAWAKAFAREAIAQWNSRREYQVHRSACHADSVIELWAGAITAVNPTLTKT